MPSPEDLLFTKLEPNIVDGTEKTEVQKITSFDGPDGGAAEIDRSHSAIDALIARLSAAQARADFADIDSETQRPTADALVGVNE